MYKLPSSCGWASCETTGTSGSSTVFSWGVLKEAIPTRATA